MTSTYAKKIILFIMLFVLTIVPIHNKFKKPNNIKYDKIVVYPGDTLWSIAEKYGDDNTDIRKTVYDIQEVNNLNSPVIMPGQVILVPEN